MLKFGRVLCHPARAWVFPLYQPHSHTVHHLLWCPLACRLSVARFTKRLKWECNVVICLCSLCELSYCAHAIDAHIYLSEKKQYINRLQLLFLAIICIQRGDSDPSWKNRDQYISQGLLWVIIQNYLSYPHLWIRLWASWGGTHLQS